MISNQIKMFNITVLGTDLIYFTRAKSRESGGGGGGGGGWGSPGSSCSANRPDYARSEHGLEYNVYLSPWSERSC